MHIKDDFYAYSSEELYRIEHERIFGEKKMANKIVCDVCGIETGNENYKLDIKINSPAAHIVRNIDLCTTHYVEWLKKMRELPPAFNFGQTG
jgi:hypothetical protein